MSDLPKSNGTRAIGWIISAVAGLGGAAAGAGSMLAVYLRPVEADVARHTQDLVDTKETNDRLRDRIASLEKEQPALAKVFAEIETQFLQVTEYRNMQQEALEGRVAELWRETFKREMPRTTQYPVVGNGRRH